MYRFSRYLLKYYDIQVCFFSATLHSPEISDLARKICVAPTWVDLKGSAFVPDTVVSKNTWRKNIKKKCREKNIERKNREKKNIENTNRILTLNQFILK